MPLVHDRIYYEIAMAIGNNTDLSAMLKESLSTYLRKLNCLAGAVLREVVREEGFSYELVHAIPKRMRPDSVFLEGLKVIPSWLDRLSRQTFLESLPREERVKDYCFYVMELAGFGVLVLAKSAPGFSEPEIKSLAPINAKLAGACIACDVNNRLKEEIEERGKAEDKFRNIVDNALDGIYQSSLGGRYLRVNPAMARIFGYDTPEQMIHEIDDVVTMHYVDPQARADLLEILKRDGQVNWFEFEYFRKDGERRWMSTSARLICDEEGLPYYVEGFCRDITHAKRAESALREAKREAERLSQLKSNLLNMVSHELRTPMTSVLGFAKIMRKRLQGVLNGEARLPDEAVRQLSRVDDNTGVIIAEGERLTELINNVLDLAKLEAGQYELDMEEVSIAKVVKHSISSTEVLFEESPVALVVDVADDLPHVVGDHDRLIQVTINLLSNAVKFTVEGEVRVSAAVEDGEVVVRVSDTGIGVPHDKVEEMFETFRQLGNTLTDKPRGTGLGLPICREILEHLGGHIWHESPPGGGSVFAYALPVS